MPFMRSRAGQGLQPCRLRLGAQQRIGFRHVIVHEVIADLVLFLGFKSVHGLAQPAAIIAQILLQALALLSRDIHKQQQAARIKLLRRDPEELGLSSRW